MENLENQDPIRLTQTVQKGGCAAKVAAHTLREILASVRFPQKDDSLLIDGEHFDDAAIYQVTEDLALVQTLDFFTPIVDSPNLFGKIAAANAISDVYAMGGTPKTAMAILGFPLSTLGPEVVTQVLQGGCDILSEAKVNFVGGHSIDDDTLKFGLSVTGYVHPKKILANSGAQVGDLLILTKPLGTGTLTAGLKRGAWTEAEISEATSSMIQINKFLDLLTEEESSALHAATDITGFGLAGHGYQMAKASHVQLNFKYDSIPQFELAPQSIRDGFLTKAHRTNNEYTSKFCHYNSLDSLQKTILFDPQTSGGLLLSVSPEQAPRIFKKLQKRFLKAQFIGSVQAPNKFWCEFQ